MATVSDDRTIKLWDGRSFRELAVIRGHDSAIVALHFSTDGRKLITASSDRTAKIWDVELLLTPEVLEGHTEWVFSSLLARQPQAGHRQRGSHR